MPAPDGRLRVAVDARHWRSQFQTGVERYVLLLLEALATLDRDVDVAVLARSTDEPALRALTGQDLRVLPVRDRHPARVQAALHAGAFDPDLIHYPFALPRQFDRPSVYTLHDAGRYRFPDLMVKQIREVDNDLLRDQLHAPNLRAVITVSKAARDDINEALGPLPQPLAVVPNFVAAPFRAALRRARTEAAAAAAPSPFLLAVGVYMPTKNIPRLIRAFRLARDLAPDVVPEKLRLVGRLGWERGLPRSGPAHRADVEVMGNVSNDELAQLYATCTAFVWPTLYEGFGLPLIEAMTAGTRILCSDIPVNREVAGDLATYTDPYDDDQMAKAIVARCQQPGPNPSDIDRHLQAYTATAAAAALLDTYRRASYA